MDRLTKLLGYWNNSLPDKVDYADLVCATAFTRGYRMVYEDEYGYVVENTIEALEELQQYRIAEQNGLLLRLPCKVGDTVWVITSPFNVYDGNIDYEDCEPEVFEAFVSSVTIYKDNEQYRISAKFTNHFIGVYFRERDFGKTIFLTQSEAEQALERQG